MTATTMKGIRKQRTLNHSYLKEARQDFEDALAAFVLVEQNEDLLALRRARKALDMADRRLQEIEEKAIAPEGQSILSEPEDDVD